MTVEKFRIKESVHSIGSRRNIIRSQRLSHTHRENIEKHIDQYGYVCSGYKRKPHFSTDLTADHPIPTSKGGDDYQTLEIFCRSCNSSKQATI